MPTDDGASVFRIRLVEGDVVQLVDSPKRGNTCLHLGARHKEKEASRPRMALSR